MNRKKRVRRGEDKKERKNRREKAFHSLRVILPVHTRITAALECGHLPRQAWPLDCYFQHDVLGRMGHHVDLIYGP